MRLIRPLALLLVASGPGLLATGEIGVLLDKQIGKAQSINLPVFGKVGSYDAVSPTGMGFRVGFSLINLKVAELGAELTYHPKAEGDVVISGYNTGQKLGTEYLALGAKVEWKFLVNLYGGMEIRQERLTLGSEKVNYSRPWIKAGIGTTLPLPFITPTFRLELAMPTVKDEKSGSMSEVAKALAPQFQVSLYAGIKF